MNTILEVMKCKVESLDLSVRCSHCMKDAGIKTLEDLTRHDVEDLKKMRNFGKKSLEEIIGKLSDFDLSFNMDNRAWCAWGLAHLKLIKQLKWEMVK